jgi:hypothetical protein
MGQGYFGRVGDHHVTVHVDVRVVLVHPLEDGGAHGDVWDKVAAKVSWSRYERSAASISPVHDVCVSVWVVAWGD